jgi:hypothetical protein
MSDLRFSQWWLWRIASSGMLRHVALVRTDVSGELSAYIIRVTRIGELGTTLAVTSNRRTLRSNTWERQRAFPDVCKMILHARSTHTCNSLHVLPLLLETFAGDPSLMHLWLPEFDCGKMLDMCHYMNLVQLSINPGAVKPQYQDQFWIPY